MAYLSENLPAPEPDIDDIPLWSAYGDKRLVFQRCAECGRFRHPPSPVCPYCLSDAVIWAEPSGPAVLFTYTITHVSPHGELKGRGPFNVALVDFPESGHVRLVSNIVGPQPEAGDIGSPLDLVWEPFGDGMWLPRFRLAG